MNSCYSIALESVAFDLLYCFVCLLTKGTLLPREIFGVILFSNESEIFKAVQKSQFIRKEIFEA